MRRIIANKDDGKYFEQLFYVRAESLGYGVWKNELSARYISSTKIVAVKSDLDFKIMKHGSVAYIDCKNFSADRFAYSFLEQHQIDRAVQYNSKGVTAGFLFHFMKLGKVYFYSGTVIARKGPRSSFGPEDGIELGPVLDFDLAALMTIRNVFSNIPRLK